MTWKNLGSSCETCRQANVTVTLEWTLRRLKLAKLKSLIKSESNWNDLFFSKANRVGGNDNIGDHQEQDRMLVQMFFMISSKNCEKHWNTINIPSTSSQRCHAFPSILVRGHGRVGPEHPQPPWPRGAVGQPQHGRWKLRSAAASSLGSCRGKKCEKLGAPQNRSATQTRPELKEHCSSEMSWSHRVGCSIETMSAMSGVKMTWIPPETVDQQRVQLEWSCFSKANRVGGNDILIYYAVLDHKEQHKVSMPNVLVFQKMVKNFEKYSQHFIPCLRRIPSRILGPRPRPCLLSCAPTAALASRSRWTTSTWPFPAARCSAVKPRNPRKKRGRNFGCLKATQTPPQVQEDCM